MFEPLPALIRLRREQLGLTLDALSALAGVSRSRLAVLEKGDDNISLELLVKVANALGLKEIRIGGLEVRAATPEFSTLVAAAEAIQAARKIILQAASAGADLERAAAPVSALLAPVLPPVTERDALHHFGEPPDGSDVKLQTKPTPRRRAGGRRS
jgi:transcriptional regulator with XRE-family HTH domain